MIVSKRKASHLAKGSCKYFFIGNCKKFHCRCFDCKEYLVQAAYRRNTIACENWRSIV